MRTDRIHLFTRRSFLASVAFALALPFAACRSSDSSAPLEPIHLVILHTNDVHGQVLPLESAAGTSVGEVGGLARVAAYIERVRAEEPNVVVVDAGDWSQG